MHLTLRREKESWILRKISPYLVLVSDLLSFVCYRSLINVEDGHIAPSLEEDDIRMLSSLASVIRIHASEFSQIITSEVTKASLDFTLNNHGTSPDNSCTVSGASCTSGVSVDLQNQVHST
jgi:hypothetical protein